MKRTLRAVIAVAILLTTNLIFAQTPTVQDCLGAIPVCEGYYYQANAFSGTGNYPNEIASGFNCSGNECMNSGERNDVWYIITALSDGELGFLLTPNTGSDDYDWAVYDITFARCEDIITRQHEISCNWSGTSGATGPNGGSGMTCVDASGPNKNALIPVTEGQQIVINISNYTSSQSGYSLDFASSTAAVYDTVRPEIGPIFADDITCGDNQVTFQFTENVQCTSVNTSTFEVDGPGGPYSVTSVFGLACSVGGEMEKEYTITVDKPFASNGTYYIKIVPFSSVKDACDNIALPNQYPFYVDLGAPTVIEFNMDITNSTCGQSNGAITGIVVNGTSPLEYTWTDDGGNVVGNELDLTGVPSGQYSLAIEDPNGCTGSGGPYQIDDDGAPVIETSAMVIVPGTCDTPNGSITGLSVQGSTTGLTYIWTDDMGNTVGNDIDLIDVIGGEYNLAIIDENDCQSIAGPFTIETFTAPIIDDANVVASGENCSMVNGFISGIVVLGSSTLTYEWTDGSGTVVGTDVELDGVPAGTYTLTVTDEYDCIVSSVAYTIDAIDGPQLSDMSIDIIQPTCNEESGSILGITASGNSGLTYDWRDDAGATVGTELELEDVGPGIYTLYVTDAATCESILGPYELTNTGGAFIDLVSFEDSYCEANTGTISVEITGGEGEIMYSVNGGLDWFDSSYFENLAPGSYNVVVRDEINCLTPYADVIDIVNFGEAVDADLLAENPICRGEDLQLGTDNSGAAYDWTGPNGFSSNEQNPVIQDIQLDAAGQYNLIVTTPAYGCNDSVSIDLEVQESYAINGIITPSRNPILPADSVTFVCTSEEIGVDPVYEWRVNGTLVKSGPENFYATNEIFVTADISCTIISNEPCADPNPAIAEFQLTVDQPILYLPNSFNPNSTVGNHLFRPVTSVVYMPNYQFIVYNKWGQKIYETTDIQDGWDGTINGKEAPNGTYAWAIRYTYTSDDGAGVNKVKQNGTVVLLR